MIYVTRVISILQQRAKTTDANRWEHRDESIDTSTKSRRCWHSNDSNFQ